MKNCIRRSLLVGSLLAFVLSLGAVAQDRDHDNDGWYQSRDSFYHGEHWRAHFFERVRDDLDRVQSSTFPASHDEYRLVKTKQELGELQDKMTSGRYDQDQLDDVISALQRVVDSNKLSSRDRDMLSDDLSRMRDYRGHHSDWGHDRDEHKDEH